MVHIDGDFPYGYDDITLQAIEASGGGVAGSVDEALLRLGVTLAGTSDKNILRRDLVDGYEWSTVVSDTAVPTDGNMITHDLNDPFVVLAARNLILSEMYRQRGHIERIETLDSLHILAKEYGIVTPYSSMIVLVNDRQQERLSELEAQDDRFERDAEEMGETTPAPMEVTGVPEPHEWILILLGVAILGWYAWNKRMGVEQRIVGK
jgi:putative PEP-CTERM system integral membrane protein